MRLVASSCRMEVKSKRHESAAWGKNRDERGLATRNAIVLILGAIFEGR